MKERIKAVRKALNLTQAEFGSRFSLKANTITGYENGLRNPNDAIISAICKEYSVNEAWLRNGTGEMFQKETDTEMVDRILQGRNEFAKSIFRSLRHSSFSLLSATIPDCCLVPDTSRRSMSLRQAFLLRQAWRLSLFSSYIRLV